MKFQTEDQMDIRWMNDPSGYAVEDVVTQIKDAGKWDQLLQIEQDEDGVVDCDALYELLRHEPDKALQEVGLHSTEAKATVSEVIKAWEARYRDDGLAVVYANGGETPSGLEITEYGKTLGTCLEFDYVNEYGEIDKASLDEDEVFDLVKDKANGNATKGEWNGTDPDDAEFEMWAE